MKKVVYLLMTASLLLALLPAVASAHTEAEPCIRELIASGGDPDSAVDVGEVRIWNDGDYLYIHYVIDEDLTSDDPSDDAVPTLIAETHLHIAISLEGIPQTKKGNPRVGHFEYSTMHDPGVVEYEYQIPLTWDPGTELYIAAHAVVQKLGGLDGLELALPDTATMKVKYPYTGGPSYFPETTVTGGTNLDGVYQGWCVDTDHVIYQNANYSVNVYSSYEDLPAGVVEFPENLDLVNWIINQNYVGQPSACGGTYTYGDVQRAIWALVEDGQSTNGLGPWSQCRVDEILAAANANGEGFEPSCADVVAVILVPVTGGTVQIIAAQVTFIEVGVPCETIDETAWGDGTDFDGNNWAMYFTYEVQSPGPTVTPGAPTWTKAAGVRYRGYNTGKEIFLGPMLPPSALPRTEAEYNGFGTVGQKTYNITFAFDKDENKLTTSIASPDQALEYDFDVQPGPGCPTADWDAMEVLVRDSRTDSGAALQNVMLDSINLGDFGTVDKAGTPGWQNWTVTGFDFSQSFVVTADMVVDGYNGSESIKVEFNVGCLTP